MKGRRRPPEALLLPLPPCGSVGGASVPSGPPLSFSPMRADDDGEIPRIPLLFSRRDDVIQSQPSTSMNSTIDLTADDQPLLSVIKSDSCHQNSPLNNSKRMSIEFSTKRIPQSFSRIQRGKFRRRTECFYLSFILLFCFFSIGETLKCYCTDDHCVPFGACEVSQIKIDFFYSHEIQF